MPEMEGDMLSGDDALAWLESFTVGKEEELRAQAEMESEARTAEILGRKPKPETEEAVAEPAEAETAEAEPQAEAPDEAEALGWLESLAAEAEDEREVEPEPVAEPEDEPAEPVVEEDAEGGIQDLVESLGEAPAEPESEEDALSWLQALGAEETEEIESEIEAQAAERIDQFKPTAEREMPAEAEVEPEPQATGERLEAEPFGWTAFASEVVPGEGEMAEEAETAFGFTHFDDAEDMPEAEAEAIEVAREAEAALQAEVEADLSPEHIPASAQPVTEIEAVPESEEKVVEPPVEPPVDVETESAEPEMPISEPEERVQPQVEVPADEDLTAPESVTLEPEGIAELTPEVEAEDVAEPEARVEIEPETQPEPEPELETEPAAEIAEEPEPEAPAEPRPAAQVSEVTEDELDEMRAYTQAHENDEGARLTLARALWLAGEHDEAMTHYDELVQSRDKMEDVIVDLERYYEAHPNTASLLRTLGDAHMKEDNLDQALKFYNRAMDLL
jgi:pilus assembly protein FimV